MSLGAKWLKLYNYCSQLLTDLILQFQPQIQN
jgi:hypothetical protein